MKTALLASLLVATSLQFTFGGGHQVTGNYTAHEWGTFTSVQGADGVQMEWLPFLTTDLPNFVYDRTAPGGPFKNKRNIYDLTKSNLSARQRMETPVIYFYADQPTQVNVTVDFPEGMVTEWFPQVNHFGPSLDMNERKTEAGRRSFVQWSKLNILTDTNALSKLPGDKSRNHYYAARDTDANLIQIADVPDAIVPDETEKFLFYRGIGNFKAPLQVTMERDSVTLTLHNEGKEELRHLHVLQVRDGKAQLLGLERLAAGDKQVLKLKSDHDGMPVPEMVKQLRAQLGSQLVSEGLYAKEAESMLNTWQDSWFEETGVRVLYVLPREWTDRVLPLKLEPAPKNLARVMVGRAEVITPAIEVALWQEARRYAAEFPDNKLAAVQAVRKLDLGRFGEPAMRRMLGPKPAEEFSREAWRLMREASKSPYELSRALPN